MIDLDLFFSISQGTLPWQPILCKMGKITYPPALIALSLRNGMGYRLADERIKSSTNCSTSCEKKVKIGSVVFELNWGRTWKVCRNCTIFIHLAYWHSGSAGLIFAIFTSNESVFGVDDRSRPLFWYLKGRCHGNRFWVKFAKWPSFVSFIRGGSWLLAVFRRAFSYRQRWGLDMAQCAIPL